VANRVHRPLVAMAIIGAVAGSCAIGAVVYERTQGAPTHHASLHPSVRQKDRAVVQKTTTVPMPATTPQYLAPCYADQAAIPLGKCLTATRAQYKIEEQEFPSYGSQLMSITQAEAKAERTPGTPTAAKLLTYLQASEAMGANGLTNPYISGTTPVWLVTVHGLGTVADPPGNAPGATRTAVPASVYTVVMDAIDGRQIVTCTGCKTVPLP